MKINEVNNLYEAKDFILGEASPLKNVNGGENNFEVDYYSGTGAGGMHRNAHQNYVRIRHLPTGIIATGQKFRQRKRNFELAVQNMKAKLADYYEKSKGSDRGTSKWMVREAPAFTKAMKKYKGNPRIQKFMQNLHRILKSSPGLPDLNTLPGNPEYTRVDRSGLVNYDLPKNIIKLNVEGQKIIMLIQLQKGEEGKPNEIHYYFLGTPQDLGWRG